MVRAPGSAQSRVDAGNWAGGTTKAITAEGYCGRRTRSVCQGRQRGLRFDGWRFCGGANGIERISGAIPAGAFGALSVWLFPAGSKARGGDCRAAARIGGDAGERGGERDAGLGVVGTRRYCGGAAVRGGGSDGGFRFAAGAIRVWALAAGRWKARRQYRALAVGREERPGEHRDSYVVGDGVFKSGAAGRGAAGTDADTGDIEGERGACESLAAALRCCWW